MRSMIAMDTVQIEITNHCVLSCSNCTRFVPHVKKPFYMEIEFFKKAVDSMVGYPKMTGIQGGEPLLHPQFEEICNYLHEKIPYEQCGLWTTLPKGFEHHKDVICRTFKHIFVNDHTRDDIYHHPPLVAIREVETDKNLMWQQIDNCWAQMSWSASINPSGAFFCEIAASMAMLVDDKNRTFQGWPVVPGWWWRIPKDFAGQMESYCPQCGFPSQVARRVSTEKVDDISPENFKWLKDKSKNPSRWTVHNLEKAECKEEMAKYKEFDYRNNIAKRFGMFLTINDQHFWTPHLLKKDHPSYLTSVFSKYQERYK
jgi:hypothetical protein